MADTNFSAGTVIASAWLNDVNRKTYQEAVSVMAFGATGDGITDDTTAIQDAFDSGTKAVYFPSGTYKITSAIALPTHALVFGYGWGSTVIQAYGCGGFTIAAGNNAVTIAGIGVESYTALGVADPKTDVGVLANGTAGTSVSWLTTRDCNFRGFAKCVDGKYLWNSVIDNVNTGYCTTGVRLFGQSVNNTITNSRINANTGTQPILLEADGSTIGEGLMITNSLLAEGTRGISSTNGFLSLSISNTIIDLITDIGIYGVDLRATTISGSWIYATNRCVELSALAVPVDVKFTIQGSHLTATAATARAVMIGANSKGVRISGGSITNAGGSSYSVYSDADETHVSDVTRYSGGTAIAFNGANCTLDGVFSGTFEPTILGDCTAGTGTYTEQKGSYTLIGKRLQFSLRVAWTAHTGTGSMLVGALPVACKSTSGYAPACTVYPVNLTYSGQLAAVVNTGATTISLREASSGGAAAGVAMDTAATITVTGEYEIA